jgi:hypothetical protein
MRYAAHHLQGIGDLLLRRDGDGIDDHTALRALHLVDFAGLLLDGEIAVDDAEPALLSHGDGHARFGHRVHGSADERNTQLDVAGQAGGGVRQRRHNVGLGGQQQHVIEGQCLRDRKIDHDIGFRGG